MTTPIIDDTHPQPNRNQSHIACESAGEYNIMPPTEMDEKKNLSFEEAARECNAITVDAFFDKLDMRIRERFNNA